MQISESERMINILQLIFLCLFKLNKFQNIIYSYLLSGNFTHLLTVEHCKKNNLCKLYAN